MKDQMIDMVSLQLFGHVFAECFSLAKETRFPNTMRDDACLAYIQEGKHEVFSATHRIVASDKESILMKCGNYVSSMQDVSPTSPFKSVVFHLDPATIKQAFGDRDLSFLKMGTSSRQPVDPALKIEQSELLDTFVASMIPYFDNPDFARDELLSVKLQELVYILSDSGNNSIATQIIGTLYSPEQIEFDQIIESNLYTNLSIAELAHISNRSESTFKRDFKKWYHDSPAKYLKTKRLEKAAELLSHSSRPVTEIAWDTGFENASHFSTSFHHHFGRSPKEYRDLN